MSREILPIDAARRVTPRALMGYAQGLGWKAAPNGRRSEIAIYHRPDSQLHQVIIPTDPALADFGEAVEEAVQKLAAYERRSAREVLEHLLLPPADVLKFREVSQDSEAGDLPFDHAVRLVNGTRKLLLSAAHSVLVPQSYHPRLSRSEAEEFVDRCRLGQTDRGSFTMKVACPLDRQLPLFGMHAEPFARRVTNLLMQSLEALVGAADSGRTEDLLDLGRNPGMSANLCESLLLLRPAGDRATIAVAVAWSRAFVAASRPADREVILGQDIFNIAENIAPHLRAAPKPVPARWLGYVDVLRGQPTAGDVRPSGEVDFTLFDDEQGEIHARGFLDAEDYATAASAHLESGPVAFKAILRRLPRVSRLDGIRDFDRVEFHDEEAF